MFALAIQRMGCTDIARELNVRDFKKEGRPWSNTTVYNTLTNPKYAGCNVWHRTTQRLRSSRSPVVPEQWIKTEGAFDAIVDRQTFELALARLPKIADYRWTDSQIVKKARKLLKTKGRISETLILKARDMPMPSTIRRHFGSYRKFYEAIGYQSEEQDFYRGEQCERSMQLRRKLVSTIRDLFPDHVTITRVPKGTRSILLIDGTSLVSVFLCRTKLRNGGLHWVVEPSHLERDNITLFCKMNPTHDRVLSYYLFPYMRFNSHRSHENDPWLKSATRLRRLSDFYGSVKKLVSERSRGCRL